MNKRKTLLKIFSITLFTIVNIILHLFEFYTPLLLYLATVNGVTIGLVAGYFSNKIFENKKIRMKFLYAGIVLGMFLSLFWINNQISIEFYINRNKLHLEPPYISYFRFYKIGLILGIIKAFYYAIVPSIIIFTLIGYLLEKILKNIKKH